MQEEEGGTWMSVIIIVLPKLDNAKNIKRILLTHGFQSAVACSSGASALQMAGQYAVSYTHLQMGKSISLLKITVMLWMPAAWKRE